MTIDPSEIDQIDKVETAKKYGNSCALEMYKTCKYPELLGTSDSILEEMKDYDGLVSSRPSSIRTLKWHIEFFITNLYAAYLKDPTMFVSYSRNKSRYGKKSEYKNKFKLSHEFSVNKLIWFLLEEGYVEGSPWRHDKFDPSKSFQSRMKATKKLIDLINKHRDSVPSVPPERIEPDDSSEELVVVKGVKLNDKWVTKEVDGVKTKIKIKGKRRICKTPDTPLVRQMRENLNKINKVMDEAEITLDITDEELKELNVRLREDRDPYKQAIDFNRKRLHRVFLDRRLDRGGRFFGPWYQNIYKEYRPKILINGAPTLEPDFSGYHPRILYAMNGLPLPEDPYRLDGYPETDAMRKFLKTLLLTIINAKDSKNAIAGMRGQMYEEHKKASKDGRKLEPLGIEPLTDEKYLEVMDKLMEKHRPIENFFFKEKGSFLQYIDSRIAEVIMLVFANIGHPCLPIHDSFIVDSRGVIELMELMENTLEKVLGQKVKIKGNIDQLFHRLMNRLSEDLKKSPKDKDPIEKAMEDLKKWYKENKESVRKFS
jgi:hypothetical protein